MTSLREKMFFDITKSFQASPIFDTLDSLDSKSDNNNSEDSSNFTQLEQLPYLKQEFLDDSFRILESESSLFCLSDKTPQDLLNLDIIDWMCGIDTSKRCELLPDVKVEHLNMDETNSLHKMTIRNESTPCSVADFIRDYHFGDFIDEIDEHVKDALNIDCEYFGGDVPILPNISSFISPCEELFTCTPLPFTPPSTPSKSYSSLSDTNTTPPSSSVSKTSNIARDKTSKTQHNSTDKKHFVKRPKKTKATHLWKFMRSLLDDPDYNPAFIKWENKEKGVFRIVPGQSKNIAKLWGIKKNNPTMTFDKLSRSLRWCREYGFLSKVPSNEGFPKKLCFRFGDRAMDWNGN